jgi:dienelactone hydrolase
MNEPPVRCLFAVALVLTAPAVAGDLSAPGALVPSRRDVTVVRADGSSFVATLHYPGTSMAVGAPLDASAGPYPIIAFGHGFLSAVTLYQSTGAHLASWGFMTIMPQTQGGLLPSHGAFAADLVSSLNWLAAQGATSGSPWFGGVDASARGVMGHSMGGGCSLLAAQADPGIRCAVPWAAANTNPSSITAALGVEGATRLIVGSQDTIVTPSSTAAMYPNLAGASQLVTITGGYHCGFIDSSIAFCDSGSITREQQLAIVRRESTEFLLLYLKGQGALWDAVWGDPPAGAGVVQQSTQTPDLDGNGRVDGADLGLMLSAFGTNDPSQAIRGDLNDDGQVDGLDLGVLLAGWTG